MRLLHTKNLTFSEFYDDQIPKYAILSHRWGDDELSYQDVLQGKGEGTWGFRKIVQACVTARFRYDFELHWIWIDTCCINKESSAELTEAINSMFKWYQQATKCLVFLFNDPDRVEWVAGLASEEKSSDPISPYMRSVLKSSDWFSRGWTLQELLAPESFDVEFFDADFNFLGTKWGLSETISQLTGIKECFIRGIGIEYSSIATRMSWAARRRTTRQEDIAYCLLGLFGVNMPLLYGEGEKAFLRLQQEIIKQSDDESIFAWSPELVHEPNKIRGILARSPSEFVRSGNIERKESRRPPYAMTNKGLKFKVPVTEFTKNHVTTLSSGVQIAHVSVRLSCGPKYVGSNDPQERVVLRLRSFPTFPSQSDKNSMAYGERWFRDEDGLLQFEKHMVDSTGNPRGVVVDSSCGVKNQGFYKTLYIM